MEESTNEAGRSGLRWGRAIVAALIAEILLTIIVVGMRNLLPSESASTIRWAVWFTLPLFAAAGYWTARPAHRAHILNGVIVGVVGTALYIFLRVVLSLRGVAPFDGTFSLPNLLSHALKIVAGAAGGYFAIRKSAA